VHCRYHYRVVYVVLDRPNLLLMHGCLAVGEDRSAKASCSFIMNVNISK
jgi:hypothetical protein